MKQHKNRPGITLLLFAVMISSGMLLCLGVWKGTTYFFDFALQKEVYMQNRACIEGIMRWAVRMTHEAWDQQAPSMTYTLKNWPFSRERFKGASVTVIINQSTSTTRTLNVAITKERTVVARGSCVVTRFQHGGTYELATQQWTVVA